MQSISWRKKYRVEKRNVLGEGCVDICEKGTDGFEDKNFIDQIHGGGKTVEKSFYCLENKKVAESVLLPATLKGLYLITYLHALRTFRT